MSGSIQDPGGGRGSRPGFAKPRGLLDFKPEWMKQLSRELPSDDLSSFIEHFWAVEWDLTGRKPRLQESLPYPSVHLTFGSEESRILGVVRGRFSVLLKDEGWVFGVKFKPGGFYPFYGAPVSRLTGRQVPPWQVFGLGVVALEETVHEAAAERERGEGSAFPKMVELVSNFIRERLPGADPNIATVNRVADLVVFDREITQVDHLIERLNIKKRELQRLFSRYVGVSPKWVIQRYRLHEAIEQLDQGGAVDWVRLALDLGYFDQAHFIKDFKRFVGKSPGEYAHSVSRSE